MINVDQFNSVIDSIVSESSTHSHDEDDLCNGCQLSQDLKDNERLTRIARHVCVSGMMLDIDPINIVRAAIIVGMDIGLSYAKAKEFTDLMKDKYK